MSIREIPKSYEYKCDRCDQIHIQHNAGGHYTESLPPYWSKVKQTFSREDGLTRPDVETLLCSGCTNLLDLSASVLRLHDAI